MNVTFRNHPSQARHPVSNAPLFDNGEPVSLFPQQRAIYLDGIMCGYCSINGGPVTLVRGNLEEFHIEAIEKAVSEQFGKPASMNMPPAAPEMDEEEDDE